MQKFTYLRDQFPGNRHSRNSKLSFERKIVCRSDPVTLTHRLRIIRFHDHLSSGPRIPFSPFLRLHPPWLWSSACCIIKPIFALLARIRLCLHLRTLLLTHDLDDAITTLPHNCRYHHLTRYLFIDFCIPPRRCCSSFPSTPTHHPSNVTMCMIPPIHHSTLFLLTPIS